jgi:uncharacterized cofD-like protein
VTAGFERASPGSTGGTDGMRPATGSARAEPAAAGGRVVAIGGGHGLSTTLTALRLLGLEPTAVVTVADDGGSSGRLRRDFGLLPPGDLRMALLALAEGDQVVRDLFAYRFPGGDVAGHNLGNLALAALADLEGGFLQAVRAASRLLQVRGQVLPATLEPVRLAGLVDGGLVQGQAALTQVNGQVETVWLEPAEPRALPEAVAAVRSAALVLLGPGSTFTSVVPNLLVPELGEALASVAERVVYLCNLGPQTGETSGFAPDTHLAALLAHCPGLRVPRVLHQDPGEPDRAEAERAAFGTLGAEVLHHDLAADGQPGRHDPSRLAAALKGLL